MKSIKIIEIYDFWSVVHFAKLGTILIHLALRVSVN